MVTTLLILLCLALAVSLPLDSYAQPVTSGVTGAIVEARTGAPLAAVLIKVQSTGQQAFSNEDGRFEIADVPAGARTLVISVVGFGLVRRDVIVAANEVVDVSIAVAEGASTYVEDVAVAASPFREAEPGVASQAVLGSGDLLALRGLIADDPFRAAQVLPSVATGDDFRAEFAVPGLGPQRLGSHLGSRIDFTTRDGARDRVKGRIHVSASSASTVWEGPLGSAKKASWLVAVRQSYLDWLLKQIDSTTGAAFGFLDGQAKLAIDLTPRQQLRATLIAGRAALDDDEGNPGPNTLVKGESRNYIGNLQWRFTPSTTFAVSQQVYVVKADYQNSVPDGRAGEEGDDLDLTWRGGAEYQPHAAHRLEFGAQVQSLDATRIERAFAQTSTTTFVNADASTWSAAGWAQYRWTPHARLSIAPGVRAERWDLIDTAKASPWLLAEYQLRPGLRARFGAAVQYQAPSLDQSIYVLDDVHLAPEQARTIEGGLEQRLGEAWRLSGSLYHRRDSDRLRYVDSEIRVESDRVVVPRLSNWQNTLRGTAQGVEIVAERRSANGLNGWLSYAWNESELQDSLTGERFPSDWDQRHTVNAYVAYRWSGRTTLSARVRHGSNFPIRGYIGADPQVGYVLSEQRNGLRLPAYTRLDIRADRRISDQGAFAVSSFTICW